MTSEKVCKESGERFEITDEDLLYYERISPVFNGVKHSIPPPTLCPQMRFQRRVSFRNERHLFHRKCDFSGLKIVSIFPPESPYIVYDQGVWWSDEWNPLNYGRDFDFSKTFMEQFKTLTLDVPHISLYTRNIENSYYNNYAVNLKNCYLSYGVVDSEDCAYGAAIIGCLDVVDSLALVRCELCYEGINSERCYNSLFIKNCRDCSDCIMVENCSACKDCISCVGLYNKQYCINNRFVGKENYEAYLCELMPLSRETIELLRVSHNKLRLSVPHRQSYIFNSEDCSGDAIYNSKNCYHCFDITDCEDCRYLCTVAKGRSSRDGSYAAPYGPECSYEFCSSTGSNYSLAIFLCWLCHGAYYSVECQSCKNIFGCIGLRNKEYCIFNKQYEKEEYHRLVSKIVQHMQITEEWGEFFPVSFSFFPYNQTLAQEYFPLTKEQVLSRGWRWEEDHDTKTPKSEVVHVPESIDEVDDSITEGPLYCMTTGKAYKITKQELKLYRKLGLPIPCICPDERHRLRLLRRSPRNLWRRKCAKTGKEIWTTYSSERPEIVYSEDAYREEMY